MTAVTSRSLLLNDTVLPLPMVMEILAIARALMLAVVMEGAAEHG